MVAKGSVFVAHGFFFARRVADLSFDGTGGRVERYPNVPTSIGVVLSNKMATYTELSTTLGVEDLYDLLEVIQVDSYNMQQARKDAQRANDN